MQKFVLHNWSIWSNQIRNVANNQPKETVLAEQGLKDKKKTKLTSYKKQELVESHDPFNPERTWHPEKEAKLGYN